MTLKIVPNKTLKGHKLVIATPHPIVPEDLEKLQSRFPDLQITYYTVPWGQKISGNVPDEELKDATIMLSLASLPTREQVPKLEFVQLTSAGANLILKSPLFLDTDVAFCTANGVHGSVARHGSAHTTGRPWRTLTYRIAGHRYLSG